MSFKEQTGKISAYDFMDVLRQNPMFEGYEQQDAQEFLNYLLNEISSLMKEEKKEFWDPAESSETNSVKSDKTFVEHNFQGTLMNHTKCLRYLQYFEVREDQETYFCFAREVATTSQRERSNFLTCLWISIRTSRCHTA